jgi:ABC-type nitrate/sulfonate/bicarbonate transport system permease component
MAAFLVIGLIGFGFDRLLLLLRRRLIHWQQETDAFSASADRA